jgi:hypothetical protein
MQGIAGSHRGENMPKTLKIGCAVLLSLFGARSALAEGTFPKPYDATYETKTGMGTMKMHIFSNGKGQTRTENLMPNGMATVNIVDLPNHTSSLLIEAQKMIIKGPIEEGQMTPMDETQAKQRQAKDLGAKLVNGHMSQGWSYKNGQATTEVWQDKETLATVKQITTSGASKVEMEIKTLNSP